MKFFLLLSLVVATSSAWAHNSHKYSVECIDFRGNGGADFHPLFSVTHTDKGNSAVVYEQEDRSEGVVLAQYSNVTIEAEWDQEGNLVTLAATGPMVNGKAPEFSADIGPRGEGYGREELSGSYYARKKGRMVSTTAESCVEGD